MGAEASVFALPVVGLLFVALLWRFRSVRFPAATGRPG